MTYLKKAGAIILIIALILSLSTTVATAETWEDIDIEILEGTRYYNNDLSTTEAIRSLFVQQWNQLAISCLPTDTASLREYLLETTNLDYSHPTVTRIAESIKSTANARTDTELAQAVARWVDEAFVSAGNSASLDSSDFKASEVLAEGSRQRLTSAICTHYTVAVSALLRKLGIPTAVARIYATSQQTIILESTKPYDAATNHLATVAFLDGLWKVVDTSFSQNTKTGDYTITYVRSAAEYASAAGILKWIQPAAALSYSWSNTPGYNEALDQTIRVVHDLNNRSAQFARSHYDVYIDGTKLNNVSVLLSGGSNYINLRDFALGLTQYSKKDMEVMWHSASSIYPRIILLPGITYTPVGGELTARAAFDKNTDKVTAVTSDSLYAVYGIWTRVANLRVTDTQTYSTSNFVRVRDLCKIMNVAVTFDTTAIYIDSSQPYSN